MSADNIYVLGIGINEYESGSISDLGECEKDIENLKAVLMDKLSIPEGNYKLLKGKEATRKGIIKAFKSHFGQLKEGDIALLNYSGHGSWEFANKEFIDAGLEPEGGHFESIVPVDARKNGTRNIADKEIRWLVNQMQYDKQGNFKNIHFTAILDCCHSGSMIRYEEEKVRVRKEVGEGIRDPRPISELLGPYEEMLKAKNTVKGTRDLIISEGISLPDVNYISLTGCSPLQTSIEVEGQGGIFTASLIKALESNPYGNRFPTYSELYSTTRAILKNSLYNVQTPQFEYAGNVSPHDCFLLHGDKQLASLPTLSREDGKWKIGLGAIHGVTFSPTKPTTINVYEPEDLNTPIGKVKTMGVEVEFSPVREVTATLNTKKTYLAEFAGVKMPLHIQQAGAPSSVEQEVRDKLNPPIYKPFFQFDNRADYMLKLTEEGLKIYQELKLGERFILGVKSHSEKAIEFMVSWLQRIAKWEQLKGIDAPTNSKLSQGDFKLSFSCPNYDYSQKNFELPNALGEKGASVFRTQVSYDQELGGKPFTLCLKSQSSHGVYPYLFHLDRYFGISQVYENYNSPVSMDEQVELYDSSLKNKVLGIADDNLDSVLNTYLLILSKKALNIPHAVEQDGMSGILGKCLSLEEMKDYMKVPKSKMLRSDGDVRAFGSPKANWTMIRLELEVIREKYKG